MKETFKDIFQILKETVIEWNDDNAWRIGAAISFFTVLSLPGLLIISISVAGAVFGEEAVRGQVEIQMRDLIGPEGAASIQTMIEQADDPEKGTIGAIVGIITLLVGAAGVFIQLQEALNQIWGVRVKRNAGIRVLIRKRLLSFGMVFAIGFLLIVTLLLHTIISLFHNQIASFIENETVLSGLKLLNTLVTFGVITFTFAFLYKVMPDVKLKWKQVWLGALVTAGLFVLGKFAIGLYLGNTDVGSAYGAAGSLIVLLTWIFYSSLLVFFGAEFTQVYARYSGQKLRPNQDAVPLLYYFENKPFKKAIRVNDSASKAGGKKEDIPEEKVIHAKKARIIFHKKKNEP